MVFGHPGQGLASVLSEVEGCALLWMLFVFNLALLLFGQLHQLVVGKVMLVSRTVSLQGHACRTPPGSGCQALALALLQTRFGSGCLPLTRLMLLEPTAIHHRVGSTSPSLVLLHVFVALFTQ